MKITVPVSDLKTALEPVVKAVQKINTIPILSHLLLTASGSSGISLRGTDMDMEIESKIESADIASPGTITVPAHMLYNIARKLTDTADVTLEHKDGSATISVRSGRSRFTLQTLPCEEFPAFAKTEPTHRFTLTGAQAHDLFETPAFAISTEEARYYLNGVYLHNAIAQIGGAAKHKLRGAATNGHQLARVECDAPDGSLDIVGPSDTGPGIIIPRKMVEQFNKTINGEATVAIAISPNYITCDLGQTRLTSKLVDGRYPNYERVIPTGNDKIITVDRKALSEAVARVALVENAAKGRGLKLSATPGLVTLSVTDTNGSAATEDLDADYTADALDIGLNYTYLGDILDNIETDRVCIKMADAGSSVLIHGVDAESAVFVLMPMRV